MATRDGKLKYVYEARTNGITSSPSASVFGKHGFEIPPSAQSVAGFPLQPKEVALGPARGPIVIRFTAPAAGQYQVDTTFTGIQTLINVDALAYYQHSIPLPRRRMVVRYHDDSLVETALPVPVFSFAQTGEIGDTN